MIVPLAVGLSVSALAARGAFHRNSRLFGDVLGRLPNGEHRVSLTFDDGPNESATPMVLDALAQFGVRATFFVLGRHAARWPNLVARIVAEGHQLGNHGYHHEKLHLKSPGYVRRDIQLGASAIADAAGKNPRFFRPPHGFRSPWVSAIARSLGHRTVGWTLGVWDSDRPGEDTIVQRTLAGTVSGSIVLLHDGDGYDPHGDRMQTARAIPEIISGLRDRGFGFVTLPES